MGRANGPTVCDRTSIPHVAFIDFNSVFVAQFTVLFLK